MVRRAGLVLGLSFGVAGGCGVGTLSAPPGDDTTSDGSIVDRLARITDGGSWPDAEARAHADAGVADAKAGPPRDATSGGSEESCPVPDEARAEDSSHPTTVVGNGSPASCTSSAFVDAVARGGVIVFDCGSDPVTITLDRTAKVVNDASQQVVIDGGGKVTLSGGGRVRILYQNTCDEAQVWTTPHCDNQPYPELTVQNLTFIDGSAKSTDEGGGAIYAQGGRLKVVNSHFYGNACADTGPDVGGGAIRALQQHGGKPVFVVGSTFGSADGGGNVCSNGGALSSIGVSYTVLNSVLVNNRAVGNGANPAKPNTPGGGSGGAIYNDGNAFHLRICGSTLENNHANEGGGAIFFVSNDRSGSLSIEESRLENNESGTFENFPGMFVIAASDPTISSSIVR